MTDYSDLITEIDRCIVGQNPGDLVTVFLGYAAAYAFKCGAPQAATLEHAQNIIAQVYAQGLAAHGGMQ